MENVGAKQLLISSGSVARVDKILMQDEYENALKDNMDADKNC